MTENSSLLYCIRPTHVCRHATMVHARDNILQDSKERYCR